MERLIKKMGDTQAAKASSGSMSAWLKKSDGDHVTKKLPDSALVPETETKEDQAPPQDKNIPEANVSGVRSPNQAGEPLGSQELSPPNLLISSKRDEEEEENASTSQVRRLKLLPAEDSDQEEDAEDSANVPSSQRYLEQVTEEHESDEEALPDVNEHAQDEEEDDHEGGSDSGATKNVKATDFDDEEEFFLAGGDIAEAKTRKDWDFHVSDDEQSDTETPVDDSAEKETAKQAKEAARQLQRDTERLLREKRCIIKPAPVQRRSFASFVEKLAGRNKKESTVSEETPLQAPMAPPDEDEVINNDDTHPMGMEDDEDDDDMLIVIADKVGKTPAQPVPSAPSSATTAHTSSSANANMVSTHQDEPPSSFSLRQKLLSRLMKTALSRSEHLLLASNQLASAHDTSKDVVPELFPGISSAFIASASFVGSKKGYVYKFDSSGLGYYIDGPKAESSGPDPSSEVFGLRKMVEDSQDPVAESQEVAGQGIGEDEDSSAQRVVLQFEGAETLALDDEQSQAPRQSVFRDFGSIEEDRRKMETNDDEAATVAGPVMHSRALPAPKRVFGRKAQMETFVAKSSAEDAHVDADGDSHTMHQARAKVGVSEGGDEGAGDVQGGVTDEDEDGEEGDDEQEEGEEEDEESEEEEDDDDDEEEEEEEEEAEAVPVKKTLADVTSIQKQSALRLGTLEAGYLRTEEKMLGIHEDVDVAEEDLGEGIDLEDTDGEDAEEEYEDSDEERKVREGFIEDAKFAGDDIDPELMRKHHMMIQDEDEQKMTDRILDIVQGEHRRRRLNKQDENWIPNRNARQRALGVGEFDDADMPISDMAGAGPANDADEEEKAAWQAAMLAKQRMDRMRFIAEKRAQEAMNEADQNDGDLSSPVKPAGLARQTSCSGPSLLVYGRSLSTVGPVLQNSATGAAQGGLKRQATTGMPMKRGCSLLGACAPTKTSGSAETGQVSSSKSFYFSTNQKSGAETAANEDEVPADQAQAPSLKRSHSYTGMNFPRKAQCTLMKRTTSILLTSLEGV